MKQTKQSFRFVMLVELPFQVLPIDRRIGMDFEHDIQRFMPTVTRGRGGCAAASDHPAATRSVLSIDKSVELFARCFVAGKVDALVFHLFVVPDRRVLDRRFQEQRAPSGQQAVRAVLAQARAVALPHLKALTVVDV